mmetsp:Transcript_86415/g.241760  ORF Transcript_86415/g.241760 Transcript_86415/m.241760 type:complete len:200 (-) Transcript_86415:7-606(-)
MLAEAVCMVCSRISACRLRKMWPRILAWILVAIIVSQAHIFRAASLAFARSSWSPIVSRFVITYSVARACAIERAAAWPASRRTCSIESQAWKQDANRGEAAWSAQLKSSARYCDTLRQSPPKILCSRARSFPVFCSTDIMKSRPASHSRRSSSVAAGSLTLLPCAATAAARTTSMRSKSLSMTSGSMTTGAISHVWCQ